MPEDAEAPCFTAEVRLFAMRAVCIAALICFHDVLRPSLWQPALPCDVCRVSLQLVKMHHSSQTVTWHRQ